MLSTGDDERPSGNEGRSDGQSYDERNQHQLSAAADVRATALRLQAAGFSVVPPKEDGSKRPDGPWRRRQRVRASAAEVEATFANRHGVGIVTGRVSGDLTCLEFETGRVFREFIDLAEASDLGGLVRSVLDGYLEVAPRGGAHLLYRCPDVKGNTKLALEADGETLVETRGEGGFVVVAPSHGPIHPTGLPYVILSGGPERVATITPEDQERLFALARSLDQSMPVAAAPAGRPLEAGEEDARPGTAFNTSTTAGAVLKGLGWAEIYRRGEQVFWRRPGKAVGHSGVEHLDSNLFVCWSTSVPLEAGKGYSPFGLLAALKYGGDFAACSRALAAEAGSGRIAIGRSGNGSAGVGAPGQPLAPAAPALAVVPRGKKRVARGTLASDIRPRPTRWLWDERVPLGALGLLGGREGIGKSTIAYQIAADITRGRLAGEFLGEPRSVIVAATEDSWERTIVPRLMAAGADLTRIVQINMVTLEETVSEVILPNDLEEVESLVVEHHAAMVLIDPLLSRLDSKLDTHKDAEVRLGLEPLVRLADNTGAAILGIIHVNKSSTLDPLTSLMGSRAFAAVARSVLFVMTDPDDPRTGLLGQVKNSLGRNDHPSKKFTIEVVTVGQTDEGTVRASRIVWAGDESRSIREVLESSGETSEARSAVSEATGWLDDYLVSVGGSSTSAKIKEEGRRAGHSADALKRARLRVRAVVESSGWPRTTFWSLPGALARPHARGGLAPTAPTAPTGARETTKPPPTYPFLQLEQVGAVGAVGAGPHAGAHTREGANEASAQEAAPERVRTPCEVCGEAPCVDGLGGLCEPCRWKQKAEGSGR